MPNNGNRAMTAELALITQSGANEVRHDPSSAVVDMLTNLMHFCQKKEIDFNNCLRIANNHFITENGEHTGPVAAKPVLKITYSDGDQPTVTVNGQPVSVAFPFEIKFIDQDKADALMFRYKDVSIYYCTKDMGDKFAEYWVATEYSIDWDDREAFDLRELKSYNKLSEEEQDKVDERILALPEVNGDVDKIQLAYAIEQGEIDADGHHPLAKEES